MIYNIFPTFEEAKSAQHYDHLFQKAQDLATASNVDLGVIRSLGLHIQNENGVFPLDDYISQNNIEVEFADIYEHAKKIWRLTTAWAVCYGYENSFVYRRDHSDRTYNTVEIIDQSVLKLLDENGNEILIT